MNLPITLGLTELVTVAVASASLSQPTAQPPPSIVFTPTLTPSPSKPHLHDGSPLQRMSLIRSI